MSGEWFPDPPLTPGHYDRKFVARIPFDIGERHFKAGAPVDADELGLAPHVVSGMFQAGYILVAPPAPAKSVGR